MSIDTKFLKQRLEARFLPYQFVVDCSERKNSTLEIWFDWGLVLYRGNRTDDEDRLFKCIGSDVDYWDEVDDV